MLLPTQTNEPAKGVIRNTVILESFGDSIFPQVRDAHDQNIKTKRHTNPLQLFSEDIKQSPSPPWSFLSSGSFIVSSSQPKMESSSSRAAEVRPASSKSTPTTGSSRLEDRRKIKGTQGRDWKEYYASKQQGKASNSDAVVESSTQFIVPSSSVDASDKSSDAQQVRDLCEYVFETILDTKPIKVNRVTCYRVLRAYALLHVKLKTLEAEVRIAKDYQNELQEERDKLQLQQTKPDAASDSSDSKSSPSAELIDKDDRIVKLTDMITSLHEYAQGQEREVESLRKSMAHQADEAESKYDQLLARLNDKGRTLAEKDALICQLREEIERANSSVRFNEEEIKEAHVDDSSSDTVTVSRADDASSDDDPLLEDHKPGQQVLYPRYDERGNARVTENIATNKRRTASMPLKQGKANSSDDEEAPKTTVARKTGTQYPKYNDDATARMPRTPGLPKRPRATSMPLYVPFANFENHNWVIEPMLAVFDDNATQSTATAEEVAEINAKAAEETILLPFLGLDMIVQRRPANDTRDAAVDMPIVAPPNEQDLDLSEKSASLSHVGSDVDQNSLSGQDSADDEDDAESVAESYGYGSYSGKDSDASSRSGRSADISRRESLLSAQGRQPVATHDEEGDASSLCGSSVGPDEWVCPEVVEVLPTQPVVNRPTGDKYVLEILRAQGMKESEPGEAGMVSIQDIDEHVKEQNQGDDMVLIEQPAALEIAETFLALEDVGHAKAIKNMDGDKSVSESSIGPDEWVCPEVPIVPTAPLNRPTGDKYVLEILRAQSSVISVEIGNAAEPGVKSVGTFEKTQALSTVQNEGLVEIIEHRLSPDAPVNLLTVVEDDVDGALQVISGGSAHSGSSCGGISYGYGSISGKGSDTSSRSERSVSVASCERSVHAVESTFDDNNESVSGSSVGPDEWTCPDILEVLPPAPIVNRPTGDKYAMEILRAQGKKDTEQASDAREDASMEPALEPLDEVLHEKCARHDGTSSGVLASIDTKLLVNDDDELTPHDLATDAGHNASQLESSVGPDDWVCPDVDDILPPQPVVNRQTGDKYVLEIMRAQESKEALPAGVAESDKSKIAEIGVERKEVAQDKHAFAKMNYQLEETVPGALAFGKNVPIVNGVIEKVMDSSDASLNIDDAPETMKTTGSTSFPRYPHYDERGNARISEGLMQQPRSRTMPHNLHDSAREDMVFDATPLPPAVERMASGNASLGEDGLQVNELSTCSSRKADFTVLTYPIAESDENDEHSEQSCSVDSSSDRTRSSGENRSSLSQPVTHQNHSDSSDSLSNSIRSMSSYSGRSCSASHSESQHTSQLDETTLAPQQIQPNSFEYQQTCVPYSMDMIGVPTVVKRCERAEAQLQEDLSNAPASLAVADYTAPNALRKPPGQGRRARSGSLAFGGTMLDVAKGAGGAAFGAAKATVGAGVGAAKYTTKGAAKAISATAEAGVGAAKYTARSSVKAISVTAGAGMEVAKFTAGGAAKAMTATSRGAANVIHAGASVFHGEGHHESDDVDNVSGTPGQASGRRPPGQGRRARSGSLAFGGTMLDVAKGAGGAAMKVASSAGGAAKAAAEVGVGAAKYTARSSVKAVSATAELGVGAAKLTAAGAAKAISTTSRGAVSVLHAGASVFQTESSVYLDEYGDGDFVGDEPAHTRRIPGQGRRARSGSLAFGGTMLDVARGAGGAALGAAKVTGGVAYEAAKATVGAGVGAAKFTTKAGVGAARYTTKGAAKAISATTRGAASVLHVGASAGGRDHDVDQIQVDESHGSKEVYPADVLGDESFTPERPVNSSSSTMFFNLDNAGGSFFSMDNIGRPPAGAQLLLPPKPILTGSDNERSNEPSDPYYSSSDDEHAEALSEYSSNDSDVIEDNILEDVHSRSDEDESSESSSSSVVMKEKQKQNRLFGRKKRSNKNREAVENIQQSVSDESVHSSDESVTTTESKTMRRLSYQKRSSDSESHDDRDNAADAASEDEASSSNPSVASTKKIRTKKRLWSRKKSRKVRSVSDDDSAQVDLVEDAHSDGASSSSESEVLDKKKTKKGRLKRRLFRRKKKENRKADKDLDCSDSEAVDIHAENEVAGDDGTHEEDSISSHSETTKQRKKRKKLRLFRRMKRNKKDGESSDASVDESNFEGLQEEQSSRSITKETNKEKRKKKKFLRGKRSKARKNAFDETHDQAAPLRNAPERTRSGESLALQMIMAAKSSASDKNEKNFGIDDISTPFMPPLPKRQVASRRQSGEALALEMIRSSQGKRAIEDGRDHSADAIEEADDGQELSSSVGDDESYEESEFSAEPAVGEEKVAALADINDASLSTSHAASFSTNNGSSSGVSERLEKVVLIPEKEHTGNTTRNTVTAPVKGMVDVSCQCDFGERVIMVSRTTDANYEAMVKDYARAAYCQVTPIRFMLLANGNYEYQDYTEVDPSGGGVATFAKLAFVFVTSFILTGYIARSVTSFTFPSRQLKYLGVILVVVLKFVIKRQFRRRYTVPEMDKREVMGALHDNKVAQKASCDEDYEQLSYMNESWTESGLVSGELMHEQSVYQIDFDRSEIEGSLIKKEKRKQDAKRASMLPQI
ncbi:hypothetical protein MPSEU_000043800 [Mayamaea pseudoterrestris]|nr:hypothetical protein MPSEU_000043800 [Mayamaea pseudoterrestris]